MNKIDNCGGETSMKRGRGRPKHVDSRKNAHSVRFDDEEEAMLVYLESESEGSKSDIIRKALRSYYRVRAKKW